MQPAALGFRAHSGWAAMVAIGGVPRSPVVVGRRRIELADSAARRAVQPYHAAAGMDAAAAEEFIARAIDQTRLLAGKTLLAAIDDLRKSGYDVRACGILLASGRPLPNLASTLASHALIHTAEGELFRGALTHASQQCGLALQRVKERELFERASQELAVPEDELRRRIVDMGRTLGPPWRQDEKLAALVGWLAFAAETPAPPD